MAEEILCRHCHKRISADYSGATCPSCGAQLSPEVVERSSPDSQGGVPPSSRRKVWVAVAVVLSGGLLLLSLMAYSAFCGVARVVAGIIGFINLSFILTFITRKILSAAEKEGRLQAARLSLVSALVVMLASMVHLIGGGIRVPCSVALLSFPSITLLLAIYVLISRPRENGGSLGHIALIYVVLMFGVIWLWVHHSFSYIHHTPYDYGPFRGFDLVALILGGLVLAIAAQFTNAKGSIARKRGLAALILFVAQAPVGVFIVYDNVTYKYPSWYETRILRDCRNISTALGLFRKDTGVPPIYSSSSHNQGSRVDFLYGNMGGMPGFTEETWASWGHRSEDAYFVLVTNGQTQAWYRFGRQYTDEEKDAFRKAREEAPSAGGWAGPYLPYITDDPWGFAYLISVSGFRGGTKPYNHVWCLSAGPNHIVDTPAWATETRGDDIGYRTK